MSSAESLRLNNPLNIELVESIKWVGMSPIQDGGRFINWLSPQYCYRCAAKLMERYALEGIETVPAIIATWSPRKENPTAAYAANVLTWTGFAADRKVTPDDYPALFRAMTRQEIGAYPYADDVATQGVALANPHLAMGSAPVAAPAQPPVAPEALPVANGASEPAIKAPLVASEAVPEVSQSHPTQAPEKLMSTPQPVPPSYVPSNSTTMSGVGGALAAVIIFALSRYGITFPAGMEAAIAVLASTAVGYLPSSGRKS